MFLGVLQFDVHIHDAQSLKDKRRVTNALRDRMHRSHLVSVAQVGHLQSLNVARMAIALVSGSELHVAQTLDRITNELRAMADAELGDCQRHIFRAEDVPAYDERDDQCEATNDQLERELTQRGEAQLRAESEYT